ncbi:hypothetical protein BKA83DRAFT_4224024, partial [Pisolithus microcarpus]
RHAYHTATPHRAYNCAPPQQEHRKTTLADETEGKYIGPVDPSQFLEEYLPCSNSTPPRPLSKKELETLEKATKATSETEMYQSFKDALERFAHGMVFADTSNNPIWLCMWLRTMSEVR